MEINLGFRFVIARTSTHYGVFVEAIDAAGAKVGTRAQIVDGIFPHPYEAADALVAAFRGTMSTRKPAMKVDELGIKSVIDKKHRGNAAAVLDR